MVSEGRRSFWSSVPGLVTGLTGLLTAIVGLVAVLIQLGVIGGKDSSSSPSTVTNGSSPASGAGGGPTTTVPATFEVKPTTLDFPPTAAREQTVTVINTSRSGTLTLGPPTLIGDDPGRFSVAGNCGGTVPANGSCPLKVTFTPASGATLKKYSATLRISVAETSRVVEVNLTASTVIG